MIQPTCQQALFSWNLAAAPQQIPSCNLDDHIPNLQEFLYVIYPFYCYTDLHFKKYTLLMQEGKTSEQTSGILLDSNLIQSDKICKW